MIAILFDFFFLYLIVSVVLMLFKNRNIFINQPPPSSCWESFEMLMPL